MYINRCDLRWIGEDSTGWGCFIMGVQWYCWGCFRGGSLPCGMDTVHWTGDVSVWMWEAPMWNGEGGDSTRGCFIAWMWEAPM